MVRRFVLLFLLGIPAFLSAQVDTLPFFADKLIEWTRIKGIMPKFQQKDLVVRIVRLNNITQAFEREGSPAWQDDWHFMEITGDHHVDGIFSGKTHFHKGWHTYFSLGDSAMKFPIRADLPGYVATLRHDEKGIEMVLRDDPGEGEYITIITHHYLPRPYAEIQSRWQIRYVSTTEIPALGTPDHHFLKMPMNLRTSPREIREPSIDYNGDGKPDGAGNVVGEFAKGAELWRYAVHREGDLEWSFVLLKSTPSASGVLKPADRKDVYFAGWLPSGAFLN